MERSRWDERRYCNCDGNARGCSCDRIGGGFKVSSRPWYKREQPQKWEGNDKVAIKGTGSLSRQRSMR
jgi:hypothetical protein